MMPVVGSGLDTPSVCGTLVTKCVNFVSLSEGTTFFSFAQSTGRLCGPLSLRYNADEWLSAQR